MAAGLGDLIQFVDNQTYLGETILNVYNYRVTSITGLTGDYLQVLAEEFRDTVIAAVREIQVDVLVHTTLEARNLSNNLDFYELAVNQAGVIAAAADNLQPTFITAGFQLLRESLATRNGYKRFSGLNDLQVEGNELTLDSADVTAIQNALAADIVIGLATVAEPVIVRRPITPPVGTTYTYASIGSATLKGLGTQNTRKPD